MNRVTGHRWLGAVLMLPLAVVFAESIRFGVTCDYDCGDAGGRGLFLLLLLCTPPAAVGVLLAAMAATSVLALRAAWRRRR
jgi:hypothetical protein